MKKKIVIGCICIIFMLVVISIATAVSNEKNTEKKVTPLFRIRAENAIQKEEKTIVYNFLIKITNNRLFFLPFQLVNDQNDESNIVNIRRGTVKDYTCPSPPCTYRPGCMVNDVRQQFAAKDTVVDFSCKYFYTCHGSYPCS